MGKGGIRLDASNPHVAWAMGVLDFDAQQYAADDARGGGDDNNDGDERPASARRRKTVGEHLYRVLTIVIFCILFPFITVGMALYRVYGRLMGITSRGDHEVHFVGDDYSDERQQEEWRRQVQEEDKNRRTKST